VAQRRESVAVPRRSVADEMTTRGSTPGTNGPVELLTLADHQGFSLRAFCQACDRSVELDQPTLIARLGGEVRLDAIRRRLRCRQCGRRTGRLLVGYHQPAVPDP